MTRKGMGADGGIGEADGARAGLGAVRGDEMVDPGEARRLWHLLEPLHAVLYYAPQVFEEAAALGYGTDERWPSYFPFRAAPLGAAGGERVASAFYSFSPRMVAAHMDSAWATASPADVLRARERGMDRAYRAIFGDRTTSPELAASTALLRRVAEAANTAGRPLAAANAELPWPRARTSSCGTRRRSCANTVATGTSRRSSSPDSTPSRPWSRSRPSGRPPYSASRAAAGAPRSGAPAGNGWSHAAW